MICYSKYSTDPINRSVSMRTSICESPFPTTNQQVQAFVVQGLGDAAKVQHHSFRQKRLGFGLCIQNDIRVNIVKLPIYSCCGESRKQEHGQ